MYVYSCVLTKKNGHCCPMYLEQKYKFLDFDFDHKFGRLVHKRCLQHPMSWGVCYLYAISINLLGFTQNWEGRSPECISWTSHSKTFTKSYLTIHLFGKRIIYINAENFPVSFTFINQCNSPQNFHLFNISLLGNLQVINDLTL